MNDRRLGRGGSLIRDFYAALISELDNPENTTIEDSVDRALDRTIEERAPTDEPESA